MLIKILKRLLEGKSYSPRIIAAELGVSEGMAQQMLLQLENMGYIEKSSTNDFDEGCCSGCSSKKKSCCTSRKLDIDMIRVTSKGREAAARVNS
ncbi:MAG: FeoC-like transcriptional regulator [Clostridium sp.]|nr:FeoC-like transcriptional regulator [Clostridium sp.]